MKLMLKKIDRRYHVLAPEPQKDALQALTKKYSFTERDLFWFQRLGFETVIIKEGEDGSDSTSNATM